jgi:hypothetical protein
VVLTSLGIAIINGASRAMTYSHLGLRDWPFRIVPEPEFCDFLADRLTLRTDIEHFLSSLETRPTSEIQLIWSWYGAGKTHTLYYLANQCVANHRRLWPLYIELPRDAKGFVDLYRSTISQVPTDLVIDAFLEYSTRPAGKSTFRHTLDPDLSAALTQAALGDRPVHVLLGQWLLGNALPPASHRQLGVGTRINTTDKCAVVLADVIALLTPRSAAPPPPQQTGLPLRIIWILDEVQRVEDLSGAAQKSVLSGLVGVFNRCPTGLTVFLSYTGAPQQKGLPAWIPSDLKDRIGLERPMLLPPLSSEDALLLVKELLEHFRLPGAFPHNPYHPFERESIDALIRALSKGDDLKPRRLMEALDASLRYSEPSLRSGEIASVGLDVLKQSLSRLSMDWSEEPHRPHKKKRA